MLWTAPVRDGLFADKKGLVKKTVSEELTKMKNSFGSMPENNQRRTAHYR